MAKTTTALKHRLGCVKVDVGIKIIASGITVNIHIGQGEFMQIPDIYVPKIILRSLTCLMLSALVITLATSCATKRETGALTGAATGTAAGAAVGDTEAAVIGGLLGTIVGHEIGRHMDRQDRQRTRDVLENNRTGHTSQWVNPDTGRRYAVTPRETFSGAGQRPCREFVIKSGERANARRSVETACRQPNGTWEIMD